MIPKRRNPTPVKTCKGCGEALPATLDNFRPSSRGLFGLTPRCITCLKAGAVARTMRHYRKNLDASRQRHREFAAKERADPTKREKINARKRAGGAGLSPEDISDLLAKQDGRCAICQTTEPENYRGSKGWNVDHCHATGKVRFILCNSCNRGLAAFHDNPSWLKRASELLEDFYRDS